MRMMEIARKINLNKGHHFLLNGVLFMLLGVLFDFTQNFIPVNIPIARYTIFFISFYFFCKGIIYTSDKRKYKIFLKFIVFTFLIWSIIVILRGIPKIAEGYYNYVYLKKLLSGDLVILAFPFLILIKPNLLFYQRLMKICYLLSFAGCFVVPFLYILFPNNPGYGVEYLTRLFVAGGAIILLTSYYQPRRKIIIVLLSFSVSLLFLLSLARRNMIVYFVAVLFISLVINLYNRNISREYRKYAIIAMILVSLFIGSSFYIFKDNLALVIERFNTGFDSRNDIIDEFTIDFNSHPSDWIFGRGLYGEFQTKTLALNLENGTRDGIENGYLNHILIGGWLYLGLLIVISAYAIFLGLFRSNNILSKAFAAVVLIYLIDMVGFGLPDATIKYLIIWISISGCYSNSLRKISDKKLKSILNIEYKFHTRIL